MCVISVYFGFLFTSMIQQNNSQKLVATSLSLSLLFTSHLRAHDPDHHHHHLCSFSRETPTRFKKELLKACRSKSKSNNNNNDVVVVDDLNQMLINIGRKKDCLSEDEMLTLLQEAPGAQTEARAIPTSTMLQLV